jgi:hypothetical protein
MKSAPGHVVARPSPVSLILAIPLAIADTVFVVVSARQQLLVTALLAGLTCVGLWRHVALRLFGRTEAGPRGIRNRMVRSEECLAWEEVDSFEIRPNLFGRVLNVRREGKKAIELASPREGLLSRRARFEKAVGALQRATSSDIPIRSDEMSQRARTAQVGCSGALVGLFLIAAIGVAAAVDRPWISPIWPGRYEASSVPRACDTLGAPTAGRLVPDGFPASSGTTTDSASSECTMEDERNRLQVRYELSNRTPFSASGSDIAHRSFQDSLGVYPNAAWRAVKDLGDEARTAPVARTGNWIEVIVRRANVVVTVDYMGPGPREGSIADTERVAQAAVHQIHLG